MKQAHRTQDEAPQLDWGDGDFYVPQFASHWRFASVPGRPDVWRRRFLERAAAVEPELLRSLRSVALDGEESLLAWARRWHLNDRWCMALARDTARWYATQPDAQGWAFQGEGIFVGSFSFGIKPLQLEDFYYDPTWRSRRDFEKYVHQAVDHALDSYCDRTEADAVAAGLKRTQRKRGDEHFEWLARYQVKSESFASIAKTERFAGGRQTVRKAVIALATCIELTPRPST